MEMIILVGPQGAGKSTFFKTRFFDTHVRVNLDMLKTRYRERLLIDACLAMKQRFVIDNTNPTREVRRPYIMAAGSSGFKVIGYYFEASLEETLARNLTREGKARISEAGVRGTFSRLERPCLVEGFDELYRVTVEADGAFQVTAPHSA